tara:strand:- start:915 stop:1460 length:546 start_codon:yes stop_codon:yes gene_type:complete
MDAILGVASGLKATKDLATSAIELTTDTKVVDKLNQLVRQIADVQSNLLTSQAQQAELQQAKHDLEQKIRELELELSQRNEFRARLARYHRKAVSPGCVLYAPAPDWTNEPEHYICPNCVERNKISMLQLHADNLRLMEYYCPSCENIFKGEANPHYEERRTRVLPDASFPAPKVITRKPR